MANTGHRICTSGTQTNRAEGTVNWVVPSRITANDGTVTDASGVSHYLVARAFGFTIPAGATILGITVLARGSESFTGSETVFCRLQDETATLIGDTKSNAFNTSTLINYTYGGIADKWGVTPTVAMVNHANFGVRLWFNTSHIVQVDYVSMAIEYVVLGSAVRIVQTQPIVGFHRGRQIIVRTDETIKY